MKELSRTAEIEAEIARTRADIGDTLTALEDKLAPRQLLEKGYDMMREGVTGDMSGRIGQTLRENPIPVALIGAGLGWLMLSQTGTGQRLGDRMGDLGDRAGDAAGAVGDRVRGMRRHSEYGHAWTKGERAARHAAHEGPSSVSRAFHAGTEAAQHIPERVSEAAHVVGDYGRRALGATGDVAGQAGRQIGQARDRLGQIIEDYPLAAGALGFIAGALIAATLPSTRWEDERFGESSDDLWREAKATGRDMADRAREVAGSAAEAASDATREAIDETAEATRKEAERQGFYPREKND